jgi:hypothetical protein
MDTSKNEHDIWMEKIADAVRKLRQAGLRNANLSGPETARRGMPRPAPQSQR